MAFAIILGVWYTPRRTTRKTGMIKEMEENNTPRRLQTRLTRRDFLRLTGKLAAGAFVSVILPSCKSPATPHVVPPKLEGLFAPDLPNTATAEAKLGSTASFHPEGPFTWELFNQVLGQTFMIGTSTPGSVEIHPSGTAWIVNADSNRHTVTVITCAHVTAGITGGDERPSLLQPTNYGILIHPSARSKTVQDPDYLQPIPGPEAAGSNVLQVNFDADKAAVTFSLLPEQFQQFANIQPLPILDLRAVNFPIDGIPSMVVGYPKAFASEHGCMSLGVIGTASWRKNLSPPIAISINFSPRGMEGMSGSPLVVMNGNQPSVVGIETSRPLLNESSNQVLFNPLDGLAEMIEESKNF